MIKNSSARCLDFIDALRAIPRSDDLISQIENFDFNPAVKSLTEIKKKMDVKS